MKLAKESTISNNALTLKSEILIAKKLPGICKSVRKERRHVTLTN